MSAPAQLLDLLLAVADDEFVLGYRNSEWTGIAPLLEEDVALSSMSQDEIGHARLLYELAEGPAGKGADHIALGRETSGFRQCVLVERPRGDWAFTMARQFLYDAADATRLQLLARSSFEPLAKGVTKVIREEKYHRMHGEAWMRRLAEGGEESRRRLSAAFEALWPDMPGFFEGVAGEAELVKSGVLPAPFVSLVPEFLALVTPTLDRYALPGPEDGASALQPAAAPGGRGGKHTPDFEALWQDMTLVYRSDPEAVW